MNYDVIKFKNFQSVNIVKHKLINFLIKHHSYLDIDYLSENISIANYIDETYITVELNNCSYNSGFKQFIIAIMNNNTGKWRIENHVFYGDNY